MEVQRSGLILDNCVRYSLTGSVVLVKCLGPALLKILQGIQKYCTTKTLISRSFALNWIDKTYIHMIQFCDSDPLPLILN